METVKALVRSLFHKESLNDCSLEELQTIARQYSYFTPVQYLLAEKLRTTDKNLYQEQLQKLSLHFNNPLWLDYLLSAKNTEDLNVSSAPDLSETKKEQAFEREVEEIAVSQFAEPAREDVSGFAEKVEETSVQPIDETDEEGEVNTTSLSSEEMSEPQISLPPLPDLNQEPAETELSFQPYHTVDYFASQGIKFVAEEKPTDRFGKQLKSFTEWLKTMKQLPQTQTPKIADIISEKKVEQMAQHSIDERDVITETMAEVWIKQGNKEKAIETYNKLSLLNPDKSAYFASLAEQLKNS